MDVKEAADAARNYITVALPGLDPTQLGLEEVTLDPDRREWRVTLSFIPPWEQQGQQSANVPRSYKQIVINDTSGSVISLTDRTFCAPKSCKIPCTAGQCAQLGCAAPISWWDTPRSWLRLFFVYPSAAVGWASLGMLYIKVAFGEPLSGEAVISSVALFVGVVIGLFAEGIWWLRRSRQRCGNKKKKRCSC